MTIEQFIKKNRVEVNRRIREYMTGQYGKELITIRNDDERRLYISNVEPLYLWAREAGVDFER